MRKYRAQDEEPGNAMDETHILISGRDNLLAAIPFFVLLFLSIFRLDQIIAAPRKSVSGLRHRCGLDEKGEEILCDPDGHPVAKPERRLARNRQKIPGKGVKSLVAFPPSLNAGD